MTPTQRARRLAGRLLAAAGLQRRPAPGARFDPNRAAAVSEAYFTQGTGAGTGAAWDGLRDAHMALPTWFVHGLDPFGAEYAAQQHRLWQLVSGVPRDYAPQLDEREHDWSAVDPVRTPGYYLRRDPLAIASAADHVLATGMILKHCGLQAGDRALEYGAGFGQTALALARLGVQVDTVDISPTFCGFIRQQADFFQVPLQPFTGEFGFHPRPGQRYGLVWFYESFHHCVNFQHAVLRLHDCLAPGGRVILGGEPIVERENDAVPYPWGLRLHSEVVAVVRKWHWFELGFTEDFLLELFTRAGFVGRRVDCEPSMFGRLYIFERRPHEIDLARHWLAPRVAAGWHAPQAEGRWTTAKSTLPLDAGDSFDAVEIDVANLQSVRIDLEVTCGAALQRVGLLPGQRSTVRVERPAAVAGGRHLVLRSVASPKYQPGPDGDRAAVGKGVFVTRLRYLPPRQS